MEYCGDDDALLRSDGFGWLLKALCRSLSSTDLKLLPSALNPESLRNCKLQGASVHIVVAESVGGPAESSVAHQGTGAHADATHARGARARSQGGLWQEACSTHSSHFSSGLLAKVMAGVVG